MSGIRRNAQRDWKPTQAQEDAVWRLLGSNGGYVRSSADGTTELRTSEAGAMRRLSIRENGEITLMESRPLAPAYQLGERFGFVGMVLSFGGSGVVIAAEKLSQPLLGAAGLVGFLVGLGLFVIYVALWSRASRQVAPRTAGWQRVGGPSH